MTKLKEQWRSFNANFILVSREEEDVVSDFWGDLSEKTLRRIKIERQGCSECGGCEVLVDEDTVYDEEQLLAKLLT